MLKRKIWACALLLTFLVGCNAGSVTTVEITRIVKETVEVTRFATQNSPPRSLSVLTPVSLPVETPQIKKISLDFDAVKVIAEFYSLTGHRHFEEAYYLLSSARQKAKSLDDYVANEEMMKIKIIKLFTVQPYYEWAIQEGLNATKDPEGIRRFVVWLSAEGEGGMAGSIPNGVIQHPVVTMVLENGEWKICSIDTIPTISAIGCK